LIKRRVVVATGNPGKVREIDAILSDPEIELLSLSGLPAVDFPEEGGDYAANAIEKARAAATQLSEWAVADDSGLEVDALDGRPGPYSARFGGSGLDDMGRVEALLRELAGVEGAARSARFVCIAALATGCERGWIYLRGEYPRAERTLLAAIDTFRDRGLIGDLTDEPTGGSSDFDITLVRGAGAYICGEETAIFNSIEGHRGEPRNKPPYPFEVGLFGKPTVVNNVETLMNVPSIVLGRTDAERRLFCLSGAVTVPGVYEVELGLTLGELIDLAGGRTQGSIVRAVLLGGAAGRFVGPDRLDLVLDQDTVREAGLTLGSGVVMVLDESVELVDHVHRIAAFFRDESCGQCVPCRVGTVRQQEVLVRLAAGDHDRDAQLELLADVGRAMTDASICGLGQTAYSAIESAVADLGVFGDG
jgi:NADH-quinone oxidoreductase subunit F